MARQLASVPRVRTFNCKLLGGPATVTVREMFDGTEQFSTCADARECGVMSATGSPDWSMCCHPETNAARAARRDARRAAERARQRTES